MPKLPDDYYNQFEKRVDLFADDRARAFLKLLESARRELDAKLNSLDDFDQRRTYALIAQVDEIAQQVRSDMRALGTSDRPLSAIAKGQTETMIARMMQSQIALDLNKINTDIVKRFAANELERVTKLTANELETIKSVLFTKIGVKGETPRRVAKQLTSKQGTFAGRFGHIETIIRTETSTVYNAQSVNAIEAANLDFDLDLNKRIVETLDNERNHPISQVLNGQITTVDGQFKASVARVNTIAAKLKRSAGGVFWPQVNGFYVGSRLPAHYRERGIVVPTDQAPNISR